MSSIGSLGLDSTSRYFMHGTKCCHRVLAPLAISTAPCCTKKLFCKKKCALEINQAANKLIVSLLYPNS